MQASARWAEAMIRTAIMMAASLALTAAVVAHAYYLKHQFYPTVVYLTKSSPSMAVSLQPLSGRDGSPSAFEDCWFHPQPDERPRFPPSFLFPDFGPS